MRTAACHAAAACQARSATRRMTNGHSAGPNASLDRTLRTCSPASGTARSSVREHQALLHSRTTLCSQRLGWRRTVQPPVRTAHAADVARRAGSSASRKPTAGLLARPHVCQGARTLSMWTTTRGTARPWACAHPARPTAGVSLEAGSRKRVRESTRTARTASAARLRATSVSRKPRHGRCACRAARRGPYSPMPTPSSGTARSSAAARLALRRSRTL
mmetsp:Transcript_81993/g.244568  ORF Transcript_81993/g.244568 Transcript_81993/m.244568 type:complete len:218 (-) Transcript_81993:1043-1696(-)